MKKVYLGKEAGKGNREEKLRNMEMNTYGSEDPKPLELAKNSPEILTGVAMEFRMFCKRKY